MRSKTALVRAVNAVLAVAVTLWLAAPAGAHDWRSHSRFEIKLSGYAEVPALASEGSGTFKARIQGDSIVYELRYRDLADVVQAHIHFAQTGVTGGISAFLSTNLGNGPSGTPLCPDPPGTVTGTIEANDVIGPVMQGIAPGEFDLLVEVIRAGIAYVNVHTTLRQTGEIRGQLE